MRYLRARFTGYIGFYNGMGLDVVDIDFSKCMHNIVLICGANGTGKSTLENALNIFPDPSSSFTPNKDAEKYLVLRDESNIYEIQIISASDLKGGRKTTKAYIKKNNIELNSNGNVSSYKDIIFSEFELDNNYISLSKLSNDDRGLGDKKPAERKRFASNIIDNLEVYNNIYKALNKKSLVYKSQLNTLHTKIQNIGIKENLETNLANLRNKESAMNKQMMDLNNSIVAIQAKNSIDESEAIKIQNLNQQLNDAKEAMDQLMNHINIMANRMKISFDDIGSKYDKDRELLNVYETKLESIKADWKGKSNRLASVSESIATMEAQINSSEFDDSISGRYKESNDKIKEIQKSISELPIPALPDMYLLYKFNTFCCKFIESIDVFFDNMKPSDIEFVVHNNITDEISKYTNQQNKIMLEVDSVKDDIAKVRDDMNQVSAFSSKPKDCKINDCPFISAGYKIIKDLNGEHIEDRLISLHAKLEDLSKSITDTQQLIDYCNSMISKSTQYQSIRALVSDNNDAISLFDPDLLSNLDDMLINTNTFGFERDHQVIVDAINLYLMLESEQKTNKELEIQYKSFSDKIQLINSNKAIIEKMKLERDELIADINSLKSEIDNYESLINQLNTNIVNEAEYSRFVDNYNEQKKIYNDAKSKLDEYSEKAAKATEDLSKIQEMRSKIDELSALLKPVMQGISTISGQLTLIDSYYKEYNEYKQQYDMIEVIKKYCSPTGGGIQTLFMQIYMAKTLDLSNQLLGMLFNGEYQLMEFVINESEFRIPFVGNGLPVDDISSGSSSQIAIMGMIINLVLLHQASTKFNIARLDEIDGPLDTNNRLGFVNTLYNLIQMLGIEQLFLISHSIEADTSSVDIIKFKYNEELESNILGNVIYDYKEEYEKTLK